MVVKAIKTCPDECPSIYKDELAKYGLDGKKILDTGIIDLSNKNLTEVPLFVRCFGSKVKCLILNNNPNLGSIPLWIFMLVNLTCLEMTDCGLIELPDSIWQLRKLAKLCTDGSTLKVKGCFRDVTIYQEFVGSVKTTMVDSYSFNDDYIAGYSKSIIKKSLVTNALKNGFSKLEFNSDFDKYEGIGKTVVQSNAKRFKVYGDGTIVIDNLLNLSYYGDSLLSKIGTVYSDGINLDTIYKKNSEYIPGYDYEKNKDKGLPICNKTSPMSSDSNNKLALSAKHNCSFVSNLSGNKVCFFCNLLHSVMLDLGYGDTDLLDLLNKLSDKQIQLLNIAYMSLAGAKEELTFGGLKYLTGLVYLDLSDNHLYAIPSQIEYLKNLRYLILSGNSILDIPDWILNTNIQLLNLFEQNIKFEIDLSKIIKD